ncbi:MAG: FAD-binding oxidoreductase [Candidatus Woesearchaeota archaeon]
MNLEKIFGKNVLSEKADCIVYGSDASMLEGETKAVVFATSTEQVQELVRFAVRTNAHIVIRGAGTGLAGGAVPDKAVVLDLSKMNKFRVDRKKKVAVVEAGVILDDLNEELKPDLRFPILPSSHSVCTIGGMLATNAVGNTAIKYGKTGDWVEELEVVDGNGNLMEVREEQLEDFVGKEGTTGIIVRAKLKLTLPKRIKSMEFVMIDDIKDVVRTVEDYRKRDVVAIEFFNKKSADLANLRKINHLLVAFESDEGRDKDEEIFESYWRKRDSMACVGAGAGYIVMEDPKIPAAKLGEFLKWVEEHDIPCFGHIGLGILHPQFKTDQKKLIDEMFEFVNKLGGDLSGEHGVGISKKKFVRKEYADLIKRLKQKYDPYIVLNRGKII